MDRIKLGTELMTKASLYPGSWWHERAFALARHLVKSGEQLRSLHQDPTAADKEPWHCLAESRMGSNLLLFPSNRTHFDSYAAENPDDPVVRVVRGGLAMIPHLIPLLADMSPTRSADHAVFNEVYIARVCDLALGILENQTGCCFCEEKFCFGPFSTLDEGVRSRTKARVQEWWVKAASLQREDGIVLAMDGAGLRSTIQMSAELIRSNREDLRQYAIKVLRKLGDSRMSMQVVEAGEVLETIGDSYCRDALKRCLKEQFKTGSSHYGASSETIFFLTRYGAKEEWDLLTDIARKQLEARAAAGGSFVLPTLWNANGVESRWGIPALALAFEARRAGKVVFYNSDDDMRKNVWSRLQMLQRLTKQDLGINDPMPDGKNWDEAVDRAELRWKSREGR